MKRSIKKSALVVAMSFSMMISSAGCGLGSMPGIGKTTTSQSEGTTTDAATGGTTDGKFDSDSERIQKKKDTIENYINNYYYFEEDAEKQEEAYFDGIMEGLDDPYSVYYTPEEYKQLLEDDGGKYEGIGAVVSKDLETNRVYVVRPIVGGPAEKAGLLPNDIFVEIDGVEITGDMDLDSVVKKLRGADGTVTHIKIYREGESDYLYFDVTRAVVENVTVSSEMLDGSIGYIKVEQFIENTGTQFMEQVDKLQADGAKSLIIDLRDNPGGLVDVVISMCDYLVRDDMGEDKGLLLTTRDKKGNAIETWRCKDNHSVDLPMVVLVNGNSASSSEIFTGCMKDYKLATIVGTNTYGKGIVQSVIGLDDGSGIKLTIAKYFTPANNDIHKVGIAPDVEVELNDDVKNMVTIPHEQDNQLQKAIEVLSK